MVPGNGTQADPAGNVSVTISIQRSLDLVTEAYCLSIFPFQEGTINQGSTQTKCKPFYHEKYKD